MCSVVGVTGCTSQTNQQAVATARGVVVNTWGNTKDGLANPASCGVLGTFSDARATQTVTGAGGGMHDEDAPAGASCVALSHIGALLHHTADVVATIKPQQ